MIAALENHLWQSTLFSCVVALLTLMLQRNRAAVRHRLWLAASVKFLVPFSLLVSIASHVEWRKAPVAVRPPLSVVEQISQPFAPPAPAPLLVSAPTAPSRHPRSSWPSSTNDKTPALSGAMPMIRSPGISSGKLLGPRTRSQACPRSGGNFRLDISGEGAVHPAVRQSSCFCISLF